MASTFPTSIDSFTDPLSTSPLNSPSHSLQHANLNSAVNKIETKLGTGTPTGTAIGVYSAYTPTFNGFTIGNGTIISRWAQVNNFVHYWGRVTLGSTSSMTGPLDLSVPININTSSTIIDPVGVSNAYNNSLIYIGHPINLFGASVRFTWLVTSGAYATQADTTSYTPFTWAPTHYFMWNFTYQSV